MPQFNMFSFNLNQFTDSCTCGGKKTNYKIPKHFIILFQTRFEVFIIRFTNHIFQIAFLLHSDKRQLQFLFPNGFQITVQCTQSEIYGLRFIIFYKPYLVFSKLFLCDIIILLTVLFNGKHIR